MMLPVPPAALAALFSFSGKQAGMIVVAIAIFFAGFGSAWKVQGWRADARRTAEAEAQMMLEREQSRITGVSETRQLAKEVQIVTVYRDLLVRAEQLPDEQVPLECFLGDDALKLWNEANSGGAGAKD